MDGNTYWKIMLSGVPPLSYYNHILKYGLGLSLDSDCISLSHYNNAQMKVNYGK